jgi:hypothetical protein
VYRASITRAAHDLRHGIVEYIRPLTLSGSRFAFGFKEPDASWYDRRLYEFPMEGVHLHRAVMFVDYLQDDWECLTADEFAALQEGHDDE